MTDTIHIKGERMMSYLPMFWHENLEMKQILNSQGFELDNVDDKGNVIFTESFIMQASASRIEEWETWLGIGHDGTLEERRLRVLAYFCVVSKMTKQSIQALVSVLYNGARAEVFIKDSIINVIIKPLPEHYADELDFTKLLTQLYKRKPCHLELHSERFFCSWGDVKRGFASWALLKEKMPTWDNVKLFILE